MKRDFILFSIIAVLAFLLFKGCNDESGGGEGKVIVKTKTLTKYLPGEPETTFVEVVKVVREVVPSEVVVINDSVKEYTTEFNDSLALIEVSALVKGELISSDLKFKPLFPKYINRVDTIKEVTTNEVIVKRWSLSGGVIFSGSAERFGLSPTLLINTKKNLGVSLGYDVINKTYNVGLFSKIKRPF